jgi:hypothetical protein
LGASGSSSDSPTSAKNALPGRKTLFHRRYSDHHDPFFALVGESELDPEAPNCSTIDQKAFDKQQGML